MKFFEALGAIAFTLSVTGWCIGLMTVSQNYIDNGGSLIIGLLVAIPGAIGSIALFLGVLAHQIGSRSEKAGDE